MKRVVGLAAFLLSLTTAGTAHAAFRMVPFQYPTIQSAVDAASPGDTVWIFPGEYRENVLVGVDDLTIRGLCLGADSRPMIDGGTGGDVVTVTASGVSLHCLSLRHGATGIYATGAVDVATVRILGSDGDGIFLGSADGFSIQDVEISGVSGYGVHVAGGLDGAIADTTVQGANGSCYYLDLVDGLDFARNQGLRCADYALEAYGDGMRIHDGTFENNAAGVYVDGAGNTIETNTIVDSAHNDDGLFVAGDDNVLEANTVDHCFYDCLSVFGNAAEIRDNVLKNSTDDYCMDLFGDDLSVVGNHCLGRNLYGVYVGGDRAEVRDNVFDGALYYPIDVGGDDAVVVGNQIDGGYDGMFVIGANPRVEANVVSGATFCPIYVDGDDPQVVDNQVSMGFWEAIFVDCGLSCSVGEVRGNDVRGAGSGGGFSGIFVFSAPGIQVADNTVQHVQGFGIEIYADQCTISSNTSSANGGYDGYRAGFYVGGDGCTISDNVATDNTGPGFRISGSDHTLAGNVARRNGLEGFLIHALYTDNALDQNVAENNHAEGIDNKGSGTTLTGNVSSGNRTDCTDDGTLTTSVGNVCADGSNFGMASAIDD